jgi:hypothetical protein
VPTLSPTAAKQSARRRRHCIFKMCGVFAAAPAIPPIASARARVPEGAPLASNPTRLLS